MGPFQVSADLPTVTSAAIWWTTLVVALLDLGLITVLVRLLPPARFRGLGIPLLTVAGFSWGGIYTAAVLGFWDSCYQFAFPAWVRPVAPVYGLFLGSVSLPLLELARRLPPHPVVSFCLLGGFLSLPGHLIGIYQLHLLEACPLLSQLQGPAVLVFGFVEFMLYWVVILGLTIILQSSRGCLHSRMAKFFGRDL